MEELRIEKNRVYTYDNVKEIFENAMLRTIDKPTGDSRMEKEDPKFQFVMMMNSVVILKQMEKNLFEK